MQRVAIGFPVPRKLLFICSQNRWRSLTAEKIFRNVPGYAVKSAGTEPRARIRVNAGHVGWADIIFVMERKHADYLRTHFAEAVAGKPMHNLRIPDDFELMDPELVEMLRSGVNVHLKMPE
jgi:predicted protein tyrosine phosphatase